MELERATRAGRPLSVIVGDLDSFSAVNENQGHAAGDLALQLVASDCLKWKRRIDQVARIGGEEFALLLPETDERGAFIVAERLRRATHRTFADAAVRVTISFGVATSPTHGVDAVGLLRAADRAVAAAKELGSDRTVIYSDEVARTLAQPAAHGDGPLQLATVIALAEALDIRDTGTGQHSRTVGRYSELMARELGLRGGARRASAARRRVARHRQDRNLRPRALEAGSARRRGVAGDVHAPRDRRAPCSRAPSSTTCAPGSSPTTSVRMARAIPTA